MATTADSLWFSSNSGTEIRPLGIVFATDTAAGWVLVSTAALTTWTAAGGNVTNNMDATVPHPGLIATPKTTIG